MEGKRDGAKFREEVLLGLLGVALLTLGCGRGGEESRLETKGVIGTPPQQPQRMAASPTYFFSPTGLHVAGKVDIIPNPIIVPPCPTFLVTITKGRGRGSVVCGWEGRESAARRLPLAARCWKKEIRLPQGRRGGLELTKGKGR